MSEVGQVDRRIPGRHRLARRGQRPVQVASGVLAQEPERFGIAWHTHRASTAGTALLQRGGALPGKPTVPAADRPRPGLGSCPADVLPSGAWAAIRAGMSASSSTVDPAGRVTASSVRSRSRPSVSASPSGMAASRCALAWTSGRSMTAFDQAGPAARGDMPRCRVQRSPDRPAGLPLSCHLGRSNYLITVFDFDVTRLISSGHDILPGITGTYRHASPRGPVLSTTGTGKMLRRTPALAGAANLLARSRRSLPVVSSMAQVHHQA